MRTMLVSTLLVVVACSGGTTDNSGRLPEDPDAGEALEPDAGAIDSGSDDGGEGARPDAGPPASACVQRRLVEPTFEPAHTLFDAPLALEILTTPEARVRYTLDGSTPSPSHGTLYSGPIPIETTSVVRAIAFTHAGDCSASRTQTYIKPGDVVMQSNTPGPGWPTEFAAPGPDGVFPADYEMDQEVVAHPSYGGEVPATLRALPSVSLVTELAHWWDPASGAYYNAIQKTAAWERPVSIEWIDPAGGPGFTANAGVRMHGQASRKPFRTPKKTMRVYFRAEYGVGKLNFPIFDDDGPVASFDRLLLRNGGNRSWPYWDRDQRREADYVADEWTRRAQLEMGGLNARGRYVHLYLNGLYWGLYNLTERPDDKFLSAHLGGLDTDFDLIKSDEDLGNIPVADAGTVDAYNELLLLLEVASVSDELYQEVAARVDLVNLADFMILTHYIGKTDWPNHNWLAYRKRVGEDTRFKFIAWDNDSGLNKVGENTTLREYAGSPVVIFNRLVGHAAFRRVLTERLALHLGPGGVLSPERCAERYSELTDTIDRAIIAESARWGDYSRDVFQWQFAVPPKSGPAYLYSRDLPNAYTDPGNLVEEEFQKTWLQVRDEKIQLYCPGRAAMVNEQYRANLWTEAE